MDARLFRRIQRYGWDAATDAYDRAWVPQLRALTTACVRQAGLRPGEDVVDLATGTGVAARLAAADVGPTGTVTGVDISEKMVARAAAQSATAPDGARLRFVRGDLEATGAADGAFDAATCAFGLMFAADWKAAAAEIARVLRPGGRLSACVWGRRSACGWADVFPIVDQHVQSEVCPLFFALGTEGALARVLAGAGLQLVAEDHLSVTLTWASADDAVSAVLEGGAVAMAWSRFDAATRAEVRAAYLASIEPFRSGGGGYAVPSEVVFVAARKPA